MALANWLAMFAVFGPTLCSAGIKLNGQQRSFSSAIKGFKYDTLGKEVLLYEKNFYYVGYVTEQWFTSGLNGPFDEHARIRIYIDGESTASIDVMLGMFQAVDASNQETVNNTPWSTRMFGRLASGGGYFNTFRIPFAKSVKITVTNEVSTGSLWYIVRGIIGVELMVGSFNVPLYGRLKVYKTDKTLNPLEFVTLSNTTNKAGMLFLVTFNIESTTPQFMEGCVRANIDGLNETTFLSSGTEDFFLSAFYFNRGEYHGFHSGLTFKNTSQDNTQIVAYKFFIDDPMVFSKSFQLIWRNSETRDGPNGCPSQFPPKPNVVEEEIEGRHSIYGGPEKARIQSYVWVYEWQN